MDRMEYHMKQVFKLFAVGTVAVGIGLSTSITTLADGPHGWGGSHFGGSRSGFHDGFRGGHWGGFHDRFWWGGGFPLGFSFSYYDAPYYGYYPAVVYDSPSVVYRSGPPPSAIVYDSPPESRVIYSAPSRTPEDAMVEHANGDQPQSQGQTFGMADVRVLVKAGISDEVILSQIRNSRVVFHLTASEIVDLKNSGVSEKVINGMINTASPPPLPPPRG